MRDSKTIIPYRDPACREVVGKIDKEHVESRHIGPYFTRFTSKCMVLMYYEKKNDWAKSFVEGAGCRRHRRLHQRTYWERINYLYENCGADEALNYGSLFRITNWSLGILKLSKKGPFLPTKRITGAAEIRELHASDLA
jgi:hypothetical protein